jgi:pSer/pThr/pTyr-binding forkhead associated (FHA) protein
MHIEFHRANTRKRITVSLASNQEYIIGSDKGSEIVFEDPGVLARHARITVADTGLFVEPIDQAPISINGHPLAGSVPLCKGD